MTAEQLEELLGKVTRGEWVYYITTKRVFAKSEKSRNIADLRYTNGDYDGKLMAIAPSLARRVIAAEKMAEAARALKDKCATGDFYDDYDGDWDLIMVLNQAITAYREASK